MLLLSAVRCFSSFSCTCCSSASLCLSSMRSFQFTCEVFAASGRAVLCSLLPADSRFRRRSRSRSVAAADRWSKGATLPFVGEMSDGTAFLSASARSFRSSKGDSMLSPASELFPSNFGVESAVESCMSCLSRSEEGAARLAKRASILDWPVAVRTKSSSTASGKTNVGAGAASTGAAPTA